MGTGRERSGHSRCWPDALSPWLTSFPSPKEDEKKDMDTKINDIDRVSQTSHAKLSVTDFLSGPMRKISNT